ncbi:hypothetical protein [Sporosarcina koreensis]|uniref:hypothetical protein n=1 Tax=Bacillales TaxID=1385 RepID=UPI000755D92C|nr:hypothetical protein [Sporosarcina koreensis]
MQKKTRVLLIIIGIVVFKTWVWDEFIVNSTANAALEGVEGRAGVSHVISKNQEIAIRPYEEGFKIYAVSKGFWGWSITDEMFIGDEEIVERILQFKGNKKIYMSFVVDRQNTFDNVKGYSTTVGPIDFNRTVGDNAFLYYHYSDKPFGRVTYEGTRLNGETEKLPRNKMSN